MIFRERDKRRHIAHSYFTDSAQLLHRAKACLADPYSKRLSYRGKIASDIVMSFECSLKSLIATHAPLDEPAKNTFSRILSFSHRLTEISESLSAEDICLPADLGCEMKDIYSLSIELRYSLETFSDMAFRKPISLRYDFTTDDGMAELYQAATHLSRFAGSESKRIFIELNIMPKSELLGFFHELASLSRKKYH